MNGCAKCSAEEEELVEIAEKERPEREERIKPARRTVSSRREESRGQMKLEDHPSGWGTIMTSLATLTTVSVRLGVRSRSAMSQE